MDGVDYPAVNNGDGTWTLADNTLPALTDGPHTITVTATDAAGNVGTDTAVVTVDTTAPNAPVLDPINATDPITGTAEAGSTVTVSFPDGTTATVVAGPDGTWSVPNPGDLTDGQTVTATATDPAGNTSLPGTGTVSADITAPVVVLDDVLTNDSTPVLTGTVNDPSATVVVNVDGTDYPAVNNGDGTWTLADNTLPALTDGPHTITVTATDAAGNVGTDTAVVTVDTTAPNAPVLDPINATDPITGTAEAGSTVTVSFPDGTTATVVAGPDGTWSVPNPGDLTDGQTVTATATDPAGNTSLPGTGTVSADITAPVVLLDDVLTNDSTPVLTGTVNDPSATVVVNVDGTDYPAVNNGDGTWTLADNTLPALTDGPHTITVTATDAAGNVGTDTAVVTVDTTAPNAPVLDPINATDPITGTAEAGSTVTVSFPDGTTATVVAGPDGTWSVPNPGDLTDGQTVTATATDPAGNTSLPGTGTVSADITAPVVLLDDVLTNDSTPALTGTVNDPTATVVVNVDGVDYPAVNNGDGTWTLADNTLPALTDGPHTITVTATDAAGNVGTDTAVVTVDTTAPNAPVLDPINATDPITGTAEAGSTVTVSFPDGTTATVVAGPDGTWSVPNPGDLTDGQTVTATATDPAGNTSLPGTGTVSADITAPVVLLDDVLTNDSTPVLTGTVNDPSATVVVNVDGTDYPAVNNGDGTWTLADNTLPALTDGPHTITVTATDAAGNVGTDTAVVTVDTTAPNAPVLDPINATDPITGTAEAGSTVTVSFPDGTTATVVAGPDGTWSVPNPGDLTDGQTVTATATDPAGNTSLPGTGTVSADITAPVVALDDVLTNDSTPVLTGTVNDPTATVVVNVDGVDYPAVNNGDGTWTLADNTLPALTDGPHTITVTATDAAGNVGTDTAVVTVDTTAPNAPVLDPINATDPITGTAEAGSTVTVSFPDGTTATVVAGPDGTWSVPNPGDLTDGQTVTATATDPAGNTSLPGTGTVSADITAPVVALDDVLTNDSTPVLTGTVNDPSATVVVNVDGVDYPAVNNGDGTWTLADNTLPALTDGPHTITVTATDAAGNVGTDTAVVTVDTTAPNAPVLDPINATDPITGTAEAGSTVTVSFPDGTTATVVAGPDGTWSVPNPGDLTDGQTVTATATDPAGNTSLPGTGTVSADITAPVVLLNDVLTNDSTPALTGTVNDPSATVVVNVDGVDYPAVNNGDGTWTLADNTLPALTDGPHTITVTATDAAGNVGTDTAVVTVDTTAPNAPVLDPINATDPITGTAEAGSTVTVSFPDGTTATVVAGPDGTWSVPNPGDLTDGQTVTATATDPAGNTSLPGTGTVSADITAPVVVLDDVLTNDSTPVLTGTVNDPSATVVVNVDGTDYPAVNNGDGTWTLADNTLPALTDGPHTITVTATDAAGNVGTDTAVVTVDTTAPNAPVLDPINATDPITGTAEAGSTVTVSFPDGTTATVVAGPDGTWSVPNPGDLTDGQTVTATATDPAGNTSLPGTGTVSADITAPVVVLDDVLTNDSTPVLTGTVNDPSATVVVNVDGVDYPAVNNGDGTWTLADNTLPALTDGPHTITVTATDAAGNAGTDTAVVTIDTTAPNAPVLDPINATDPITGTAEAGSTVTVSFPDGTTATVVAGPDGTWSVPNPGDLTDGQTVTATATDPAGNTSLPGTGTVSADITAPVVVLDDVLTNDSTPALTGTVNDPSATVVVNVDGVDYPAVNNGDGTWTLADNTLPALTDGPHTITVTATDAAGNVGTDTAVVTVDTTAPNAPVLDPINATDPITGTAEAGSTVTVSFPDGTTATVVAGPDGTWSVPNPGDLTDGQTVTATATDPAGNTSLPGTGTVSADITAPVVLLNDVLTNDSTPALTGTVNDPSATVVVNVDGTDYPAVNNGDGTWTLADNTLPALTDGPHTITVTATDAAGNVGTDTAVVTVDTTAPNAPVLDPINATDPITGTAEAGSTVTVSFPDGTTATVVAGPDGTWSVPNPGDLTDGQTVTATATDPAGNTSLPGTEIVDGDGLPPVVSLTDEVTNDATPDLSGSINDPNATIVVTVDGIDYPAVNNGDGTWTLPNDILPTLSEGAHSVTVTATDLAGNVGTDTGTVTIDTVAPNAPDIDPVNAVDPITGTAEPDSTVTVSFPDGTTATVVAGPDGTWSVPNPGNLVDGDTISATATDPAGNTSLPGTEIVDGDGLPPVVSLTDEVTNDATPDLSGSINDPNATIVVTVDGIDYPAVNNGDGTWTLPNDILPTLSEGAHSVTVTATDLAGNVGTDTGTVTIDTVAPNAPDIDPVNAVDPITGTAEPDSTVTVSFPDGTTATVVAGPDGTWSVPNPGNLVDGDTISATATDPAGNTSLPGTEIVDGDGLPPVVSLTDEVTNDATPDLSGSINDPNATIVVTVDGIDYPVVNNGDGTWTLPNDILPTLSEGAHSVTVTATDLAGNVGTDTGTVTIDTVAPNAPDIDPVNAVDPITGTAEAGSTVTVSFPDGTTATVVAGPDGTWSVPNPGNLVDGDTISATATDPAGNTSLPGTEIVDGDGLPPVVSLTDEVTNDATPDLSGSINDPNATIVVTVDGIDYPAVNNGDGTWTLPNDILPTLSEGAHSVTVTATDLAGNVGTDTGTVTIDTVAPNAPDIDPVNAVDPITGTAEPDSTVTVSFPDGTTATVVAGPDGTWSVPNPGNLVDGDTISATATDPAGNTSLPGTEIVDGDGLPPVVSLTDEVTNDATPDLSGSINDPNATIVVTVDGIDYPAVNNGDGTWTLPNDILPTLSEGAHSVTVTATDLAGNVGTDTGTVTIDTVAPNAPDIDPVNAVDPITGTAEPDSTVTVSFPDGTTATVVAGPDGTWSVPNPGNLVDGDTISATATDPAGNTSLPGTEIVDGDGLPPVVSLTDEVTNDATPDLSGSINDPNATIVVTVDGIDYPAVNNGDGTWTLPNDILPTLSEGAHSVTVTATDLAGNVGTDTGTVTIDTVAPVVSFPDVSTNDTTPALTGTIDDPLATIVVTVDGVDYPATNNGDGTWTLADNTLPVLTDGPHTVSVTATDVAGNVSAPVTGTVTVDATAPTLAITATDLNLGLGESTTVTFTFSEAVTGFDASDVTLAGGTLAGLSTADGGLTWTATFTQDGTATAPSISVADNTYTDLAGNLGTGASLAGLTSDVVAPTLAITAADLNLGLGESTTVTFTFSEAVTGFDASDVTLAGGTLAGLSTADGGLTWTATFTQDGTATAPSISVADNTYTDLAGNLGTGASLAGLTSDVVAPTLAITATDLNLGLGESTTVTFTFSEAVTDFDASDVTLAGGTLAGLSTADGGLTWTATFTQDGTATAPSISVADNTYTDLAGNLGTGASLAGLTADVVAPTLAITAADLNLGLGESTTVTFTFSEAVTGFDASDVTLAGGTLAGLSTADGGLTWTATFTQDGTATAPSISVADNTYTDLAGNLGTGASLAGLTADVVAPTLAITATDLNLGLGESTTVTFTFSEAVTGFDASDVTLAGGTLAGLSTADGGLTWTATFTQDGTATAPSISVADNTYTDLAGNLGTGASLAGLTSDVVAPTLAITAADLNLGLGESTTVTFTFSEAVTGFDASDVTLAGGTLAGLSTADGGLTWTATFTQDGTATAPSISVADNTYTDLAGNLGTGASLAGLTSDVVAPTLAITATDLNLGLGESTTVTFTFSEAVTGFDASDVTLAGGTLAGLSTADGGLTWTATFTQDGTATAPSISVADNTYTDLAGNLGTGASLAGLTADVVAPTLAITATDLNLGLGESTTVTFTFSEAVTDFDASDVTLAGGTLAGLSTADGGLTWTATFTQDGTATAPSISVADNTYTDLAGNLGTGASLAGLTADVVAPTLAITAADLNLGLGESTTVTFTFSEAVTGFDASDVTLAGGTLAGLSTADGGLTWTATFTQDGTATAPSISVADNTYTDLAGNLGTGASLAGLTSDVVAPTLAITATDLNLGLGESTTVTFTFSEAVTGFDASDVTLAGGTLAGLSTADGGLTWTATFTQDGTATAPSISVADNTYTDLAGNLGTGASLAGLTADVVAPTLAITATDLNLGLGESTTVTFTFSEAVTGFDASDVTLAGGTLAGLSTADGGLTWTATFTQDGTATAPSISVADNTYTDLAGNLGTGASLAGLTADVVAPTLAITAADLNLGLGESTTVTFTFSEAVTGFDASDVTLAGGTLAGLSTADGGLTWTATFTQDGTATAPSISVADNTYTDLAGNLGTGASLAGLTSDVVAPTLAITATDLNLGLGESTTVTFTFSEAVTGFDASDVTLAGGTLAGLSTADGGLTWTATFTQDGTATAPSISVADNTYTDLAGNLGTGASLAGLTADVVAPTLAITAADLNLGLGESTTVTFTFSEAVTGFDASDVTLAGGTLAGLSTADGGLTWTATFTQDGTATAPSISVADNTYTDLAGNLGTGASLAGLTADVVAPTLAITATDLNLGLGESTTVTFTFSEAVTGFDASDVTLAGGTLAGLSTADGGLTWTATFTQDGTATAPSISVADNTYTDLAGNLGTGASLAGLTSDVVAPTLAITAADLNLGLGESTTVTFTFSEAVTGFDASDVTLAGGTLAGLSTADGGLTWTATFTQDGTATAPSISVADNTYTDLAGNLGTGASLAGLTSDVVAPTLAITATDLNLGLGESTTVTFTFSEAVTDFDASDVTLAGGTLAGLSTADGGLTWTATFTQDGTATAPSISVADNTYTDLAGNLGTGASLAGLTADVVAPTLAITATDLNLGLGESTTVTFTFSEAVTGFDASDVTLAGGTLAGLSTADGGLTWTATFTQDGTATAPSISVADNTYTDLAGNLGTGASLAGLTADVVAPTLAITATDLNLGLGESTTVTFTFSEAVTGFDASDVTLAGGTLAGLSTADGGLTWTATFTQDGTATAPSISVADNTYTDLAGNLGTGASLAGLTSDVVAPTLAISADDLNLGLGESTTVTFTFSEAVTGFDASDVTLAGGTLAGLSTADGGLTWTATFTQDGTATAPSISVADNTYTDLAGNLGTGASLAGLTSDVVAPTLAISADDLNLGLGESTTVTFTFSEAVTGFDASDVTLAGGTLAGLSTADGGLTWTATFTQDGTATAPSISVADNTYTDLAGNLGTGASLAGLTSDVVAPTLAISAADLNLGLGESTTVTFTFSEAVTGFDASDVIFGRRYISRLEHSRWWIDLDSDLHTRWHCDSTKHQCCG